MDKKRTEYKGFNKNLTKKDLDEKELDYYNELMDGIHSASIEEKKEIAHLMEVFIDADEDTHSKCIRCGDEFNNDSQNIMPESKKVYCNRCLRKMWSLSGQEGE